MKKECLTLAQEDLKCEKLLEWENIPVLSVHITLPQCAGHGRRVQRFNRFYRRFCRSYLKYCETELLPRAAVSCREAMARSAPWVMARAELRYTVTLQSGAFLCLYTDAVEENLPPRLTIRRADTWDMREALPIPVQAFFPDRCAVRRRLLLFAREQACAQSKAGSAAFYPNYRTLLRRKLNTRNYYLTEEGLCFFYPMYSVAPAAEQIVRFLLPYGEDGPFAPDALTDASDSSNTMPRRGSAPQA